SAPGYWASAHRGGDECFGFCAHRSSIRGGGAAPTRAWCRLPCFCGSPAPGANAFGFCAACGANRGGGAAPTQALRVVGFCRRLALGANAFASALPATPFAAGAPLLRKHCGLSAFVGGSPPGRMLLLLRCLRVHSR